MSGEKEREREKGLKRRTDRASFCGKKRGVRSKVVVLEVEKKRVRYVYIYIYIYTQLTLWSLPAPPEQTE